MYPLSCSAEEGTIPLMFWWLAADSGQRAVGFVGQGKPQVQPT